MVTQSIDARYVDRKKLQKLLMVKFPSGNYKVKFQLNRLLLELPIHLTEDEIGRLSGEVFEIKAFEERIPDDGRSQSPKEPSFASSTLVDTAELIPEIRVLDEKFVIPPSNKVTNNHDHLFESTIELPFDGKRPSTIGGFLHEAGAVSDGFTCRVYAVRGMMRYDATPSNRDDDEYTRKFAIKRLSREFSKSQFIHEYEILKSIGPTNHPNVVQILKAFSDVDDGIFSYNFLFPLAAGSLRQLFHNELNNPVITKATGTLWQQLEGLASAIAFLHDKCIAHRDVKPANILLYENHEAMTLTAKIADFGLAIGAKDKPRLELGTLDARSAFKYDPPEVRQAVGNQASAIAEGVTTTTTFEQLWMADIWKLAAVYTETLSPLVRGNNGVQEFRAFITTTRGNFTSDDLSNIEYDDGVKVKAEVLNWLQTLEKLDAKAGEIAPLITEMFADAASRPTALQVTERLRKASFSGFSDGKRLVRFAESSLIPPLSTIDRLKSATEAFVGAAIDWRPFAPAKHSCPADYMRISWRFYDQELSVDVPRELALQYKKDCVPLSSVPQPQDYAPMRSLGTTGQSLNLNTSSSRKLTTQQPEKKSRPAKRTGRRPGTAEISRSANETRVVENATPVRWIFWCVDKAWSERVITFMCSLGAESRLSDDLEFCQELLKRYHNIRGFRAKWFSWKTCVGIKFISFARVFTAEDEVTKLRECLPPAKDYEYKLLKPEEVHMAIAAEHVLAGMYSTRRHTKLTTTLSMIPQKKDTPLTDELGSQGWGLHTVQGFSMTKILMWIGVLMALGMDFVVFWLVRVDKTSLSAAFAPVGFFCTVIMLAMGVVQILTPA